MKSSRSDPDCITLFSGWSRLTTTSLGEMESRPLEGFFRAGTQLVTHYRILVNGKSPIHTLCSQTSAHEWAGVFLVPETVQQGNLTGGEIPGGSIELRIQRNVDACWDESIRVRNYAVHPQSLELRLELGCPIGDVEFEEEMKAEHKVKTEGCIPEVSWEDGLPRLSYEREFGRRTNSPTEELKRLYGDRAPRDGEMIRRGVEVGFKLTDQAGGEARFEVEKGLLTSVRVALRLQPRSHLEFSIEFVPKIECEREVPRRNGKKRRMDWQGTRIRTGNPTVNLILAQAQEDLESLALPEFGSEPGREGELEAFNAGVPRYIGMFSRDILTTAWQAAFFSPKYLKPALSRVAIYRGVKYDAFRDEEPHRIPHERRLNPKAAVGETNRELYYGDVVSTPFWIVTLGAAYNWTGDRKLLREYGEVLDSCWEWVERRLEEGAGFLYYAPSLADSVMANRNHAWKDSGDAIVDGRGRIRLPPIAAAEVQGYCYFAMLFATEMALAMGRPRQAKRYLSEARELKRRFNQAFWMEDRKFFALALDRDRKPVDSIASNIGHCLGTGLIDADKVAPVVRRLMSPELFSGWGIRTLSTENPAYDPFSYHRGSVWPVENSTIAAGMAVCGYEKEAQEVIRSQFELASLFPGLRLPEVVGGQERSEAYPVPGLYPQANLLQAWSVSAIALEMLVLLGVRPIAPMRMLFVKPSLPAWLPWVEIDDLQVGQARVGLRFWRDAEGKGRWKVTRKQGHLWVTEQPADLSPDATLGKRVEQALQSVSPFKLALGASVAGAALWRLAGHRR